MKILYRYVLRQFIATQFFALFALCIIFVIVNLLESLDKFLDNNTPFVALMQYYIFYLPEIIELLMPVSMLLAALFTIGNLSTRNEITAMKSGGMSLYSLMIPLMTYSIMISAFMLYFNGWVVPAANHNKIQIEQRYLHKQKSGGPIYNLYFRDNPKRNIIMQYYDALMKVGNNVVIEDYSSEITPRLVSRTEARSITWDSTRQEWKLNKAITRTYQNDKVITRFDEISWMKMKITHDQIVQLKRSTDEMNYEEFRDYIDLLEMGGKDVRRQMIEYHGNYAFPFANLIVVLFAVPFASVRKKGGIAVQIAAAMIISFSYLIFQKTSQSIGYSLELDPILTGWTPNIIFITGGLFNLFNTKT